MARKTIPKTWNAVHLKKYYLCIPFIETYCLSFAEAMIVGVPTVTSFTGAMPELARHGEESLFYNSIDYQTCATYGSDINDFGRYALSKFLTIDQFNEYDWKNNYKNSTFKVSVNTQVQTGFLITEIKE